MKVYTLDCSSHICSVNQKLSRLEAMNKIYVEEIHLCFCIACNLMVILKQLPPDTQQLSYIRKIHCFCGTILQHSDLFHNFILYMVTSPAQTIVM